MTGSHVSGILRDGVRYRTLPDAIVATHAGKHRTVLALVQVHEDFMYPAFQPEITPRKPQKEFFITARKVYTPKSASISSISRS